MGLPSFNTVLHNAAASFNRRLGCSTNSLVNYVCRKCFKTAPLNCWCWLVMHAIMLFRRALQWYDGVWYIGGYLLYVGDCFVFLPRLFLYFLFVNFLFFHLFILFILFYFFAHFIPMNDTDVHITFCNYLNCMKKFANSPYPNFNYYTTDEFEKFCDLWYYW